MDGEELTRLTDRADRALEAGDRRKWRLTWSRIAADATEEQWAWFTEGRLAASGRRREPGAHSAPTRGAHGRA